MIYNVNDIGRKCHSCSHNWLPSENDPNILCPACREELQHASYFNSTTICTRMQHNAQERIWANRKRLVLTSSKNRKPTANAIGR